MRNNRPNTLDSERDISDHQWLQQRPQSSLSLRAEALSTAVSSQHNYLPYSTFEMSEKKSLSFSFSKKSEKVKLKDSVIKENDSAPDLGKEYLTSVEDKKIKRYER